MGERGENPGSGNSVQAALLDLAPVGMVLLDSEGGVSWANQAAHRILRPSSGALLGLPLLSWALDRSRLGEVFDRLARRETTMWEGEDRWKTADGRSVWLHLQRVASPVDLSRARRPTVQRIRRHER